MTETFKDRMKRLRLRAGLRSQQSAADAIGCERGTVGMWEAPSSAVDSVSGDYLLAVARAYQVRPDYINTGKGIDGYPWSAGEETPTPSRSQSVRLDAEMILDVVQSLQAVFAEIGLVYSVEDEPGLFAEFLEDRIAMRDIRSIEAKSKVGKWLKRGAVQGDGDERDSQVPAKGAHKGKTGGSRAKG